MYFLPILQYGSLSLLLLLFSCSGNIDNNTIRVGLTSTLEDSGVLSLLIEEFEKNHPIKIKAIIAGSGKIHRLIEANDIDTAITHDPEGERDLIANKIITARYPLIKNDFLIVGPKNDPAHIKQSLSPDEALKKIINAQSLYISRNDNSGTHQMEKQWSKGIPQLKNSPYIIKTGSGMGATLTITAEKKAYTLVDRGTWLHFKNKQTLTILFEDAELLPNAYSVLSFNPNTAKQKNISLWENWLIKGKGAALLKSYRIDGKTVFQH